MEVKAGMIGFVHSEGFIPEGIQFFETIQEILERDLRKNEIIFNHVFGIVENGGQLFCVEMEETGKVIRKWEDTRYYNNEVMFVLKMPKYGYLSEQLTQVNNWAMNEKVKGYDFLSILWQMIFTVTKWWPGKTGNQAQKRYFCSELWATLLNRIWPTMFPKPYKTNPHMLFENNFLITIGANFKF